MGGPSRYWGRIWVCGGSAGLAAGRQERRPCARAIALYAESIPLFQSVGVAWNVAYMLDGLAGIACAWGQGERAVRLYGAATALRDAVGGHTFPDRLATRDRDITALRR